MLQRRVPTVHTVQKTDEIPQVVFLDTVETPVVVQRQVLGYDSAENCGISAVAVLTRWSMSLFMQFIDKIVDVAVIMQRRRVSRWRCLRLSSSPEFVDIPVVQQRRLRCFQQGGDEGFFRLFRPFSRSSGLSQS